MDSFAAIPVKPTSAPARKSSFWQNLAFCAFKPGGSTSTPRAADPGGVRPVPPPTLRAPRGLPPTRDGALPARPGPMGDNPPKMDEMFGEKLELGDVLEGERNMVDGEKSCIAEVGVRHVERIGGEEKKKKQGG